MRKLVVVSVLVATMGVLALASADNAPPSPTIPIRPAGGPRIVAVTISAPARIRAASGADSKGAIPYSPPSYEIEVANPTALPIHSTVHVFSDKGSLFGAMEIDVPAKSSAKVKYPLDMHSNDGCNVTTLHLLLKDTTEKKVVKLKPTCTFTTTPIDPEASLTPQQKADARKNKISYDAATLTSSSVSCGAPFGVKAIVKNGTSGAAVPRLVFGLGNAKATAGERELTPSGSIVVTPTFTSFPGLAGDYLLTVDPLPNTPAYQPGWGTKVSRSCTFTATME